MDQNPKTLRSFLQHMPVSKNHSPVFKSVSIGMFRTALVVLVFIVSLASSPSYCDDQLETPSTKESSPDTDRSLLYCRITSLKTDFLIREPIFVRNWIENRGSRVEYIKLGDMLKLVILDSTGDPIPERGLRVTDWSRHGTSTRLEPSARSSDKLRALDDSYQVYSDSGSNREKVGKYFIFMPGYAGDTLEISIFFPTNDLDSLALSKFESAVGRDNLIKVFYEFPASIYSLLAAYKLLGYPHFGTLDREFRKRLEFKILEVAEQGYVGAVLNLDPMNYSGDECVYLRKRFEELEREFGSTEIYSEMIRYISRLLR